jgi:hypothetical protein
MATKLPRFWIVIAILFALTLACSLPGMGQPPVSGTATPAAPSNIGSSAQLAAAEGGSVQLPDGPQVVIPPGALSQDAPVSISDVGKPDDPPPGSPFHLLSDVYAVELGGASLDEPATISIPLGPQDSPVAYHPAAEERAYAVMTQSDEGLPMLVGASVAGGKANAHVMKSGKYLLVAVIIPTLLAPPAPLQVPSYPQKTPAWCSPTALTDLAQFHQGFWPAGDDGSVFGESSNWYLAGKASQPFNNGYFFHSLLAAGGFDVPVAVGQTFTNANMDVVIWYFDSPVKADRGLLWPVFKSFVQNYVWGYGGEAPRPVAWGSSIAGHSRIITGSDGTNFFYNDPSNGQAGLQKVWDDYKTQALTLADGEVVDTVVFHFPPRPESERRGVIWLVPGDSGSVRYTQTDLLSSWMWDGANGHSYGYYYDDKLGGLASVPTIDHAFDAGDVNDQLVYNFQVYNISTESYSYHIHLDLIPEGGAPTVVLDQDSPAAVAPKQSWVAADAVLPLQGLKAGTLYTLKYTLTQAGVVNDIKYVKFQIRPLPKLDPNIVLIPIFTLDQNAFCREGPGQVYRDVTAIPKGDVVKILNRSEDNQWFYVLWEKFNARCWVGSAGGHPGGDLTGITVLAAPPTPSPTPTAVPAVRLTPTRTPRKP